METASQCNRATERAESGPCPHPAGCLPHSAQGSLSSLASKLWGHLLPQQVTVRVKGIRAHDCMRCCTVGPPHVFTYLSLYRFPVSLYLLLFSLLLPPPSFFL